MSAVPIEGEKTAEAEAFTAFLFCKKDWGRGRRYGECSVISTDGRRMYCLRFRRLP